MSCVRQKDGVVLSYPGPKAGEGWRGSRKGQEGRAGVGAKSISLNWQSRAQAGADSLTARPVAAHMTEQSSQEYASLVAHIGIADMCSMHNEDAPPCKRRAGQEHVKAVPFKRHSVCEQIGGSTSIESEYRYTTVLSPPQKVVFPVCLHIPVLETHAGHRS